VTKIYPVIYAAGARGKIVWLIFMCMTLSQSSIDIYIPSMPVMQLSLGTTASAIQLTLTLYLVGYASAQLIYGYLADRYGRRPALLTGYVIYIIASMVCVTTHQIDWLLLGRFLQGFGIAASPVVTRTIMRDVYSGNELARITSYMAAAWAVLPIIAPMLGGYIEAYFGWQMNFRILLVMSIVFAICIWRFLPETRPSHQSTVFALKTIHSDLLRNRMFLWATLGALCGSGFLTAYSTQGAFLLEKFYQLSPVEFGWFAFAIAIFTLLGSFVNGQLVRHYGSPKLLQLGFWILMLGLLLFFIISYLPWHTLTLIMLPMAILFFAEGMLFPNFSSTVYNSLTGNIGVSIAIMGTVQVLGSAFISAVVAYLPIDSLLPLACVWLVITLIMALAIWKLRHSS